MFIIGGLVAAVAAVGAFTSGVRKSVAPPVPLTTQEKIALVAGITYEETIPYMEATFTFGLDGLARHCEGENNFQRLPPRGMHQWIAETATRCYMARGGPRISENWAGERQFGESPWGFFSVPENRKVLEPCFNESKDYYAEILLKPGGQEASDVGRQTD
jgi:hypothetical protein